MVVNIGVGAWSVRKALQNVPPQQIKLPSRDIGDTIAALCRGAAGDFVV
jgi:hypothetical protein